MSEPNTVNVGLVIPNTGDLVGTWGSAAVNPNMQAIDGMFGGFATLSLSSATTFALSTPSGSLTPGAGPNQSQNACLFFTGTLTGNCVVQLTMPGRYIMHNKCTVGTSYIQIAPSAGTGTAVGLPPGQKVTLHFDGTNVDYVDTMPVGAAFDLHGATSIPPWISACTVAPYLLKDGSTYSTSVYAALGAMLGSTFGGNGVTTFAVPDELARARIAYDTTGTGRLTTAISGVNGTTMGSAGGNQSMQQHNHSVSLGFSDPGHAHDSIGSVSGGGGFTGGQSVGNSSPSNPTSTNATNISFSPSIGTTGSGSSQNVQPSIISFLPLIKTVILLGFLLGGLFVSVAVNT